MSASPTPPTKEGKVNVALGDKEALLDEQAKIAGTTKTNLARTLILDGLTQLKEGQAFYRAPAIVSRKEAAPA